MEYVRTYVCLVTSCLYSTYIRAYICAVGTYVLSTYSCVHVYVSCFYDVNLLLDCSSVNCVRRR